MFRIFVNSFNVPANGIFPFVNTEDGLERVPAPLLKGEISSPIYPKFDFNFADSKILPLEVFAGG